jgi:DNA polymerase-3 subunit epsilon
MKKILVLDIETSGFKNQGGSIVEIGIVELNLETGEVKELYDSLCKEDRFDETHTEGKFGWIFEHSDLTFEEVMKAPEFGVVKNQVQSILDKYPLGCTAFNNSFDFGFLRDRGIKIKGLPCPMILSTSICKLPNRNGYGGYKWPKVEEAYDHFFPDNDYTEKHRGMDDAKHEAKIVFELWEMGIFKID